MSGALSALLLLPVGAAAGTPASPEVAVVPRVSAPTVELTLPAYTKALKTSVKVVPTVPEGAVLKGYYLSEDPTTPLAGATGWNVAAATFTLDGAAGDGERTVYAWVRAKVGTELVVSAADSAVTFLDRQAPTATFDVVPTTSTSRNVAVTLTGSDPGSQIAGLTGSGVKMFAVVNGTEQPSLSSSAWKTSAPTTFKLSVGNGSKTVSAWVRDYANNVSEVDSDTVTLNAAGASLTVDIPAYTRTGKVTVKLTPNDAGGNGIKGYFLDDEDSDPGPGANGWTVAPTKFTFTGAKGERTIYAWVKDNNNSVSPVATDTTFWDGGDPTATLTITSPNPTTNRTVSLTATATDPDVADGVDGSGVTGYMLVEGDDPDAPLPNSSAWKASAPTSFKLSLGNGTKTLNLYVRDAAGNVSEPSTQTIALGVAAPTVTAFLLADYSNKLKVDVKKITASDPGAAGIAGYFLLESATPPASAPTASQPGWIIYPANKVVSAGDGTKTVYAWVKDKNGTVSTTYASDSVVLDMTKPVATLTVVGVAMTVTGSDATSGVAKYALVLGTTAPSATSSLWKTDPNTLSVTLATGSNTVSAFVMDNAGNISDPDTETVVKP